MKFKLKVDQAIEVLEKNLQTHIAEYQEAVEVWTEQVRMALTEYSAALSRTSLKASHDKLWRLFTQKPVDVRPQYSKYLGALQTVAAQNPTSETVIEVDEDDYDRIYNDNWTWRQQASTSNSAYKKGV